MVSYTIICISNILMLMMIVLGDLRNVDIVDYYLFRIESTCLTLFFNFIRLFIIFNFLYVVCTLHYVRTLHTYFYKKMMIFFIIIELSCK
jgi:hypothetical protein